MSDVMVRRVAAAQATLDEFLGKPFQWGRSDCARMIAAHLRRLGYKVQVPSKGSYATPKSALKALRARGFESMADAIDAVGLERIAPAEAVAGDIVCGDSGDPFGALGVKLSNGRLLGYHEHIAGAAVLQELNLERAWRVEVRA
jgi:hypothetical protein